MKKLLCLCLFLAISMVSYGQVLKAQAYEFRFAENNGNGWSEWSKPEPSDVMITIDIDNLQVTMNTEMEQIYRIVEVYDVEVDAEGDEMYRFQCIDSEGIACRVSLGVLNTEGGRQQVYVEFSDMSWVYNVNVKD